MHNFPVAGVDIIDWSLNHRTKMTSVASVEKLVDHDHNHKLYQAHFIEEGRVLKISDKMQRGKQGQPQF